MNSENEPNQMLMLYQVNVNDIHWIKRQQWTIGYYVLLVYAALFGLYSIFQEKFVENFCSSQKPVVYFSMVLIALFVNCAGIFHFADIMQKLCLYRFRLLAIKKKLGKDARATLEIADEVKEGKDDKYPR